MYDNKTEKYLVLGCCLLMLIFIIMILAKTLFAQVLTEEEMKKRDAKEIQKIKDAQKFNAQVNEQNITIEDVKIEPMKEIIIRKYKPSTTFYEVNSIQFGQPMNKIPNSNVLPDNQTQQIAKTTQPPINETVKFEGFCMPAENYELSVYPVPATLNCLVKNKRYNLKGRFVPNIQTYFLSFTPTEFALCKNINNLSIIRRADYSPNLASNIDKKVIENILLRTTASTGSDTASALVNLMKSPPVTQIISTNTTTTITQQTQTTEDIINKVPYLAGAYLLENASKELLAHYGGRIPPIFTVSASEIYQIEGQCNSQN